MTRDEKVESLNKWCFGHACDSKHCRIHDRCLECKGSWDEQTDEVIDKIFEALEVNISTESDSQTAKADAGKAEIRLVPMEIVWAIAWIRMYGNRKYGDPENWKTVEPERYRDAMMRHLLAYISDPKSVDEESGYPHLWHAACNMAFLMHFDYGDMVHQDYAKKAPVWEAIGKAMAEGAYEGGKHE